MRWFRQHIRNGSWLALVAIAINFTLAFGHVHALDGKVPERTGVLIAAIDASGSGPGQHHPADGHADYLCPICMAATAMGSALAPAPPTLPIEFAEAGVDRPIDQFVSAPRPLRAAFQSRGPPIS
jgi:hypothetical protein